MTWRWQAFGFNVLDSDVEARIVEDAVIQATQGNIGLDATHSADIRNFALAVQVQVGGIGWRIIGVEPVLNR